MSTTLPRATISPLQKAIWITAGMMLAVIATLAFSQTWSADAAPGDDDATYVAIPNCRAFDFRPGQLPGGGKKTPLGPNQTHTQQITGAVGDCSIPNSAVGVAMNVTVANGTAQSNLRVFPGDLPTAPTVSNLNWMPGDAPTPNKVDVKLSPAGTINIYNQNGTVDVIGDIVGYYTSESLQQLNQNVEQLFDSLPFSVTETANPIPLTQLVVAPLSIVDVTVTAPVAGDVVVHSSAVVGQAVPGSTVSCFINDSVDIDMAHLQRYEADDHSKFGSIAGHRAFQLAAGETRTFHLVCIEGGGGPDGTVGAISLTAAFTPAA
ncbi:MAG: hypothetical protein AAGA42_09300 [Actinomycetota bacterium]